MDEHGRPQGSGPPGQRQKDGCLLDGAPGPMQNSVLAEDRTYRVIFQHTSLGICRTDPEGVLQEVNPASGRMLGCTSEALVRETARLQSIMNIVKDGIHILDQAGRLVAANPAFLAALGYTVEESADLRVQDWDIMMDPGELAGWIQTTIQGPRLFETRHRRKDGSVLEVEVNAGGVELDGRMYLLASSRDITARKAFERELGLRQAQLEERIMATVADLRQKDQMLITQNRQAAMGEMIGHISHQWRQPLNALSMLLVNLGEAHRSGSLTTEKLERSLAKGDLLIQKMSSTINDFKDFFKPGKVLATFSALEQIRAAVALMEASFQAAHIAVWIAAAADVTLLGFPNEYSKVLLNLLSNAKQAIQEVPGRPGAVSIRLAEEDGWGSLTVRDNGAGIAEAILPRIFEPFFSTRPSGTGIGLYLSRQIIERNMGGRISARNVEGGAAFSVQVPIAGKRP